MSNSCLIGELADFPPDEIRPAMLDDGTVLAVYNVDGTLYATADRCTHGDASLSDEGKLCGKIVECPWHFGTFDVTTGQPTGLPCSIPLKVYRVEILGHQVQITEP